MKRVNRNFLAETSKSNRISLCMARFFDYNVEKLIGGKTMLPDSYRQDAARIRRDLHKIPESGFHEFQTQAYIMRFLQELGLQGEPIAQTGVACFFDMGQSSAIAFRADMDGLCITERTAHDFQSATTGMMHACGHDGHMTMLLLLAKYLSENPIQISKNILLIFQPAEEGPGGAKVVIEEGVLQRFHVEHVFGFHLSPDYPFGTVAFTDGEFFASGVEFYIDLIGKSSHGAQPQRGTDCVKTGAHLINALLEIPARDIDPLETCVVSVGTFHAGDCVNILAGTASLSGIVRSYNTKTRDSILNRIQTICGGIETIYDCKVSPRIVITYPPLINDKKLAELLRPLLPGEIVSAQKVMLAEDFSYYAETLPCLYMLLGIRKEDAAIFPLHSDQFDFDESVLPIGLETYLSIIKAFA